MINANCAGPKYKCKNFAWYKMWPHTINMLGWHQYPSDLSKVFHQGSDEVMLALYKLSELIFQSRVVYPFKVYNNELEQYENKKNSS